MKEIDAEIDYANAPYANARLGVIPGTVSTVSALPRAKLGYAFTVQVTANPAYLFIGWEAVSTSGFSAATYGANRAALMAATAGMVSITDKLNVDGEKTGEAEVVVRTTAEITLVPYCVERPTVIGTNLISVLQGRVMINTPILIEFSKPMMAEDFKLNSPIGDSISITGMHKDALIGTQPTDLKNRFRLPENFLENETVLRIEMDYGGNTGAAIAAYLEFLKNYNITVTLDNSIRALDGSKIGQNILLKYGLDESMDAEKPTLSGLKWATTTSATSLSAGSPYPFVQKNTNTVYLLIDANDNVGVTSARVREVVGGVAYVYDFSLSGKLTSSHTDYGTLVTAYGANVYVVPYPVKHTIEMSDLSLSIQVSDGVQFSDAATAHVVLDVTPPVLTKATPVFSGNTLTFSWTASDNRGLDAPYTLTWENVEDGLETGSVNQTGNSYQITGILTLKKYTLTVTAVDQAGNTSELSMTAAAFPGSATDGGGTHESLLTTANFGTPAQNGGLSFPERIDFIRSAKDLADLRDGVNNGTINPRNRIYFLTDDIDLDATITTQGAEYTPDPTGWTPIGSNSTNRMFSGCFYGAGHTIGGLKLKAGGGYANVGLFGHARRTDTDTGLAMFRNLRVELDSTGSDITMASNGLFAGTLISDGNNVSLVNVHSSGDITVSGTSGYDIVIGGMAGRLTGRAAGASKVTGCSAAVSLTVNSSRNDHYIGGFAGSIHNSTILNTTSAGSLTVNCGETMGSGTAIYVGGFTGDTGTTTTIGSSTGACSAAGAVTINEPASYRFRNLYVGGFAGILPGTVSYCSASGNVSIGTLTTRVAQQADTSSCLVGGFAGRLNDNGTNTRLSSTGNITAYYSGANVRLTGGIAGELYNAHITSSYSRGDITIDSTNTKYSAAGGIAGRQSYGDIMRCYSTGNITHTNGFNAHSGGITGYLPYSSMSIEDCYSLGNISAISTGSADNVNAAGILATSDNNIGVRHCYAAGTITAEKNGSNQNTGAVRSGGITAYTPSDQSGSNLLNNAYIGSRLDVRLGSPRNVSFLYVTPPSSVANPGRRLDSASKYANNISQSTVDRYDGTPQSASWFQTQSNWTGMGYSTSYWNFSNISSEGRPRLAFNAGDPE